MNQDTLQLEGAESDRARPAGLTDFSFEFDLIASLFGYPQISLHKEKAGFTFVNLLNEGYSFLLRSATDLLSYK